MIVAAFPASQSRVCFNNAVRIVAVLLAAGAGRRIGGPKALLRAGGGHTFLSACAARLLRPGVEAVVAVLGCQAERVGACAAGVPALRTAVNERWAEGMLGSVLTGLEAAEAEAADAVLLHPVDHPLVAAATVDAVVEALRRGALIAVPSRAGRRGHPGGFQRAAWAALRAAPPQQGARAVLAAHPDWITHVPGDPGSLAGIDTPEDYERLLGRPASW